MKSASKTLASLRLYDNNNPQTFAEGGTRVISACHDVMIEAGFSPYAVFSGIKDYNPLTQENKIDTTLQSLMASSPYSLGAGVSYRIAYNVPGREDVVIVHELLKARHPTSVASWYYFSFYVAKKEGYNVNDNPTSDITARCLIPLYEDVASPNQVLGSMVISAASYGGFSIYHNEAMNSGGNAEGHFCCVEPIKSMSSQFEVGYCSYVIGASQSTVAGYLPKSDGLTGIQLMTNLMESVKDPNRQNGGRPYLYALTGGYTQGYDTFGVLYNGTVSVLETKNFETYGGKIGMIGVMNVAPRRSGGKLMYYAETGEKVYIPNGPIVISERFVSQRLKMCAIFDRSAAPAGEFIALSEPNSEGTAIESYNYIARSYPTAIFADFNYNNLSICTLGGN